MSEQWSEEQRLRKALEVAVKGLRCAVATFDSMQTVGARVLVVKHALNEAQKCLDDEGTRPAPAIVYDSYEDYVFDGEIK